MPVVHMTANGISGTLCGNLRVVDSFSDVYDERVTCESCRAVFELLPAQDAAALLRADRQTREATPIPMRIPCPECSKLHIDEGEFATKPHHTHACQFCGAVFRNAIINTVGVRFLPGFKNEQPSAPAMVVHRLAMNIRPNAPPTPRPNCGSKEWAAVMTELPAGVNCQACKKMEPGS